MKVGDMIPEMLGTDQFGNEIKTKIHAEQILDYLKKQSK